MSIGMEAKSKDCHYKLLIIKNKITKSKVTNYGTLTQNPYEIKSNLVLNLMEVNLSD